MPKVVRTLPPMTEKPIMEMASPKQAVSMPLTKAPELTMATHMRPSRDSRKNSADPNSRSSSRETGSDSSSASAPTIPPTSVHM